MSYEDKIKELWTTLNLSSSSEITHLFVNIRVLLEGNNLKTEFYTLNLYCNWLVHSKLDNSSCKLIEELKNKIKEHFETKNDFNYVISELLGLKNLKNDLCLILLRCNVADHEVNINWSQLFSTFLKELVQKPLECKKLKSEREYPDDFYGVKLIEYESMICWELLSSKLDEINSRIVGQLVNLVK